MDDFLCCVCNSWDDSLTLENMMCESCRQVVGECRWHPGQPDNKTCDGCLDEYEAYMENLGDEMRHGELR
jgi:hypothetical protein